jgi:hypothetical protein
MKRHRLHGDRGAVAAWTATMSAVAVLLALTIVAIAQIQAARTNGHNIASEAARAGTQHLDLNAYRNTGVLRLQPGPATAAAKAYLNSVGATGTVMVTGQTITVTAVTHQRIPLLRLLGVGTVTVTETASATPYAAAP